MSSLVWLASYPKSGNTWLRLALQFIAKNARNTDINDRQGSFHIASSRHLFDTVLDTDSALLTADEIERARPRLYERLAETAVGPQPLKVHDAWTYTSLGEPLFPGSATHCAIYIVRDPRDVAASMSYHYNFSIDDAIDLMGKQDHLASKGGGRLAPQLRQKFLSWSRHVESWLDAPGIKLHLVRYEDMLGDWPSELRRLAALAGYDATDELVDRVAQATTFSALRSQENQSGFRERKSLSAPFFRRGIAGGWRDQLTQAQAERIVREHGDVMRRLGYVP
jgi:aryl sulfotransferase